MKMNILTFDIEDWFHILDHKSTKTIDSWGKYESRVERSTHNLLNLLNERNLKATFFCLGWVADKFPALIREIASFGHEIGSHSYSHQLVYEQSRGEFFNDVKKSIFTLEDILGKKINCFRAPGFSITESQKWAFSIIHSLGIDTDCSVFPASRSHGGFSNFMSAEPCIIDVDGIKMKEFPINVANILTRKIIFSGGGYFRLLPYGLIDKYMQEADYVMTYFHPRDFDKFQPILQDLSMFRKFKSYYGINNAFLKLKRLIDDNAFVNIGSASQLIDWSQVEIIKL